MDREPVEELVDLTNQLIEKVHRDEELSEFELKRYERRANDLLELYPACAHNLLAIIGSTRQEYSSALDHHRIACDLETEVSYLQNFATTLETMGEFAEALAKRQAAERLEPTNLNFKRSIINNLYGAGRFMEASRLIAEHQEKGMFDQMTLDENVMNLPEIVATMRELELTDDDVRTIWMEAINVSLEHNAGDRYQAGCFSDDHTLFIEVGVKSEPEKVAEMNLDLAGRLAIADIPHTLLESVSPSFVPANNGG